MTDDKFNWKIWAKKVAVAGGYVGTAGLLAYAEAHPAWAFAIPAIEGLRNWMKHRKKKLFK